jgi:hypothetical protein
VPWPVRKSDIDAGNKHNARTATWLRTPHQLPRVGISFTETGQGAAPDLAAWAHLYAGFLGDFAYRGLGRRLVRFDLPAGKRPGRDAVTAAYDEHPVRAGDDRDRDGEASLERRRVGQRGQLHLMRKRGERGREPVPLFGLG